MKSSLARFNRWLTIVFAVLLAIQGFYLLVGIASLPVYYQRVTSQTLEPVWISGEVTLSNQIVAQKAAARGLSLGQYAIYRDIVNATAMLIPLGIAILIIRRASWQWYAWFTAFLIVFLGENALSEQLLAARLIPMQVLGINDIFWFLGLLYFYLFPNGKALPTRLGWLAIGLVIYHFVVQLGTVISYFAPEFSLQYNLPNWGNPAYIWPVVANFLIILVCQVYRYRRISTLSERQQTKWFLVGFALVVAMIPISIYLDASKSDGFLNDFTDLALWLPFYLGLAIAITRYRLFDLDILIRRTLVYGALTILLGLVYFSGVAVLQEVFTAVSGQSSAVAVVLSTLLIAALFNPLRKRLQDFIDRRFYRRKYNTDHALAEFAAAARSETDLEQLSAQLTDTLREALQPEHISLWLNSNH